MHASSPEDIIDGSRIRILLEDASVEDRRLFAKAALSFLNKAPAQLRRLQSFFKQGNTRRIIPLAAALREASANVGANRISGICLQLESAGEPEMEALLDALGAELKLAERRIFQLVKELGTGSTRRVR